MPFKQSIAILTGNHLCHNPRVMKEAQAFATAGFEVNILGAWLDDSLKNRDQELIKKSPFHYQPALDLTPQSGHVFLRRSFFRALNRLSNIVYQLFGLSSRWQYGYAASRLLTLARNKPSSIFIAHSELGMLVAAHLLQKGARVGLDLEDWFSEDLLPEDRRYRPVVALRQLESLLLSRGIHATCPSQAMSQAIATEFGCRPPTVVYNAFPWAERKALKGESIDRRERHLPSIHWYSQTIGRGRGLEDLFAALPHFLYPVEVHLRGNPVQGFDTWLNQMIPLGWHERVFVHPIVENGELLSRISEHDIGFAGEMIYSRSRDLTVTNKILHYLLGGLAVVASDTKGQREVAQLALASAGVEPVLLYPSGDPLALASRINWLLSSKERLAQAKSAALTAAERTFCWERQVPTLLARVQTEVSSPYTFSDQY